MGYEIIFRGYHDEVGHLILADVLQFGRAKRITSVYDGNSTFAVLEDFLKPSNRLVRIASCRVIFPDGKTQLHRLAR